MKKLILATLITLAASAVSAATLRETFDKTYDVRPEATVSLSNTNGAITIKTWDQPRVRVRAEKVVERGNEADAKETMAALRIEVDPAGGDLKVRTIYPKEHGTGLTDLLFGGILRRVNVTYELTVPRRVGLKVDDTNGAIRVSGVTGRLEIGTTNGRIELTDCAGTLDLETTNGAIDAKLAALDRRYPHSVETTNGRIELTVPPNLAAEIDAETTNGHIECDLPVVQKGSMDRNTLRASANGGGVPVKLRTTNGSIEIHTEAAAK